ncbi:hypothetical protein KY331_00355 [Candidatus Woesearchaeota archaeon]|nr:hypothetical protein [Candidatus Woesearchaeota archaeon]
MINLKILNKKAIKEILKTIKNQWNTDIDFKDQVLLEDNDGKIFITNKDISRIDLSKLRINSIGLYLAQKMIDGLRLSIEGSQLIGPKAKKNVLELTEKQKKEWIKGYDLELDKPLSGFLIIKHQQDFLGCGKAIKPNKLLNYVPKNRRLKVTEPPLS